MLAPNINLDMHVIKHLKQENTKITIKNKRLTSILDLDKNSKLVLTIMNVNELLRNKIFAKVSDKYGIIPPMKTIPVKTVAPNSSM